jgi:hypothetical protein
MKKNASIIGFISLLVLVVFVSGCTSNNTASNQSSEKVIVQINSNTPWNGTLTYNGANYNISGTKNQNYDLGTNPGAFKIYLQKNNDVGGNLTIQLLQGRKIIKTQRISRKLNEVISISHNF